MDIIETSSNKIKFFQYDEIALFFINLIIVILFIINPEIRQDFFHLISYLDPRLFLFMFLGFLFTIYHSLFRDAKYFGKTVMGLYVIFLNFYIGAKGMLYFAVNGQNFYYILFPAIDVLVSIVMIYMTLAKNPLIAISIGELISDKQTNKKELLVGIIFIPLLIFLSQYFLKNHWIITFSMALFYISVIHSFFSKIIFAEKESADEGDISNVNQNEKSKFFVKIALLIIFAFGTFVYLGYIAALQNNKGEAYIRGLSEGFRDMIHMEK